MAPARLIAPLAITWSYPVVPLPGVVPSSSARNVELLSSVRLPVFKIPGLSPGLMVPPVLVALPTVPMPPSTAPAFTCTAPIVPSTTSVVPVPLTVVRPA